MNNDRLAHPDYHKLQLLLQDGPLNWIALAAGKAPRALLAEITGLSPSLLRRGKKFSPREATLTRIKEHGLNYMRVAMRKNGLTDVDIEQFLQSMPKNGDDEPLAYASLVFALDPQQKSLSRAVKLAIEFDEIANHLIAAYERDDINLFKHVLSSNEWVVTTPFFKKTIPPVQAADNWDDVLKESIKASTELLCFLFAAIDVEFGMTYFESLPPRPIIFLITPTLDPKLDIHQLKTLSVRNTIYQPVRRLLELSHALIYYSKNGKWPEKPASRQELGTWIGLPAETIGNFFDGTKKLTFKSFAALWEAMAHFTPRTEIPTPPLPLLFFAILFQRRCIYRSKKQQITGFFLPGTNDFLPYWDWHRERWATPRQDRIEEWPSWLND